MPLVHSHVEYRRAGTTIIINILFGLARSLVACATTYSNRPCVQWPVMVKIYDVRRRRRDFHTLEVLRACLSRPSFRGLNPQLQHATQVSMSPVFSSYPENHDSASPNNCAINIPQANWTSSRASEANCPAPSHFKVEVLDNAIDL